MKDLNLRDGPKYQQAPQPDSSQVCIHQHADSLGSLPVAWSVYLAGFGQQQLAGDDDAPLHCCVQVFEGRVIEGGDRSGGHVITATSGSGSSKQTYNYATERIVGNGSFGVVFQATCLETAETVRSSKDAPPRLQCRTSLKAVPSANQSRFCLPDRASHCPEGMTCGQWAPSDWDVKLSC